MVLARGYGYINVDCQFMEDRVGALNEMVDMEGIALVRLEVSVGRCGYL